MAARPSSLFGRFLRNLPALVLCVAAVFVLGRVTFGGGQRQPKLTGAPELPGSALEKVAELDFPPGNVAVSRTGRVFFTLHPDGKPPGRVFELKDGKPVPYPSADFQVARGGGPFFDAVLALRIDQQDRLWTLDYADYAMRGQPRLLAFDLSTNELVHQYDFPRSVTPLLSMLNDFQVSPAGDRIYIAEASPIRHNPALIVYDTIAKKSRRLLESHESVSPGDYLLQVRGRDIVFFGFYTMRIGVDSIALDKRGEYLYYGPLSGLTMYRVPAAALNDETLSPAALAGQVEKYSPKPLSDGTTMDRLDNLYVTDPEHDAVLMITPRREIRTLLQTPLLRWPDGFSFGPDGWLYLTCSSLHHVLFVPAAQMRQNAPYQIYRFKPGAEGIAGQ